MAEMSSHDAGVQHPCLQSLHNSSHSIQNNSVLSWVTQLAQSTRSYRAGVEIQRQGCAATDVLFILAGIVKLVRIESDGSELITSIRSAGSFVGLAAAVLGVPHEVSAVAVTCVRIARVPVHALDRVLECDRSASRIVLLALAQDAHEAAHRLWEVVCTPARQRLEEFLKVCSRSSIGKIIADEQLELNLRASEVAQYLAVTPSHLSRLITKLQAEGIEFRDRSEGRRIRKVQWRRKRAIAFSSASTGISEPA